LIVDHNDETSSVYCIPGIVQVLPGRTYSTRSTVPVEQVASNGTSATSPQKCTSTMDAVQKNYHPTGMFVQENLPVSGTGPSCLWSGPDCLYYRLDLIKNVHKQRP
jgi:hypothetical protein